MGKPLGIAVRPIAAPSAAWHLNWIEQGMTMRPPEGGSPSQLSSAVGGCRTVSGAAVISQTGDELHPTHPHRKASRVRWSAPFQDQRFSTEHVFSRDRKTPEISQRRD